MQTSAEAPASPRAALPARAGICDYLASLNAQQRLVAEHGVGEGSRERPGPMLVIAGAGSGKTNTLAHRVAHLVVSGVDPQRILLLTFSRRAAAELQRRAGQVLHRVLGATGGQEPGALPWSGTFHSVGARLLREYACRIGLHSSFSVLDRGDAEDLLAIVRHDLGFSATEKRFPKKASCIGIYSRVVNSQASVSEVLKGAFPAYAHWESELKQLFDAYVRAKQTQNVLDLDDLLLYWSHMVGDPGLAREVGERFDHVLVDEYQDTNRLQASILLAMKPNGAGLTVVGDDAQSIYSFRAATVRNILDFPTCFTPAARVVTLDRNYRSTQPILDAANAVIGLARERFTKNLWTDRASSQKPKLVTVGDGAEQARYVAESVLEHHENGTALKSQAVLFRSSRDSAQLEIELARRGIPFVKYGGLKFLEAAHVKDVLSVLRWAENPRNKIAGFRAACLHPGIGPATARKLLDAAEEVPGPVSALEAFKVPSAATKDWSTFIDLLRRLREPTPHWPVDMELVTRWYEPHLHRLYDDAFVREGDLAQLQQIASTYASRERFLTEVTLDPPEATSDLADVARDDDYLVLSTIHSSKGQEWKTVHILNVVEGCIPSVMGSGTSEELEEERRLLYVAMTRAKEYLSLMLPHRFYVHPRAHGDGHAYSQRSRFLPSALTPSFESCAWPQAEPSTDGTQGLRGDPAPRIDIAARVRGSWQ